MTTNSLLADSVELNEAFYKLHHYRVSNAQGEAVGYFASAKCGAYTVYFGRVQGGAMHDQETGQAWGTQDCRSLALSSWVPTAREGPGGLGAAEAPAA